jgi:two-component system sensor histidine kinase/response regulator
MARIFVIDDDANARASMHQVLTDSGHDVSAIDTGERALSWVQHERPDVVLLDVKIPGLEGFDTARRLRDRSGDDHLAIVIVTALGDLPSRLLGLSLADEVIVRPFDGAELVRRVFNLLTLQEARRQLKADKAELVRQQAFKNEMAALIVHDLKNPITVMLANLTFSIGKLGEREQPVREALVDAQMAGSRLLRIVGNFLDLHRIETSSFKVFPAWIELEDWLAGVRADHFRRAHLEGIEMRLRVDPGLTVNGDVDVLRRAVENVIDNAFRYVSPKGIIELAACRSRRGGVELRIGNDGAAIPDQFRTMIFEKYTQAPGAALTNFGLGMYFCRLAAEAHGGTIRVEEEDTLHTIFVIDLPRGGPERPDEVASEAGYRGSN